MIYTCYEMIRDCRAGKPEGWTYFLKHYVPLIRGFLAHYSPGRDADQAFVEQLSVSLCRPESSLFQSLDPAPERMFVADLRQSVLAALGHGETSIGLETLNAALEPLTLTGKLCVWFETMRYHDPDTGRMLRMSPDTVQKTRARAAELLRSNLDTWSLTLLSDDGRALGHAAAESASGDCLKSKIFLDVIDGRTTWGGRDEMERHVRNCWHCLDHYCRLLEVVDALRSAQPLSEAETGRYQQVLGIQPRKRSFWR